MKNKIFYDIPCAPIFNNCNDEFCKILLASKFYYLMKSALLNKNAHVFKLIKLTISLWQRCLKALTYIVNNYLL